MDILKFLTGGRKAQLSIIGMIIAVVLGLWKNLPAETIVEYVTYIVGIGAGSIALEDGLGKLLGKSAEKPPTKKTK